jgi:hypothetical protein
VRVFRDRYLDRRSGRRRDAKSWTVEFLDHKERPRRIVAFADKVASEELGRGLERLATRRAAGGGPDGELARAIEGWPARVRGRLAKIGLLDALRIAGSRPLTDLLEDFRSHIEARARTAKHVEHVVGRATRLFSSCGFALWSDIAPEVVERVLRSLRDGEHAAIES